MFSIQFLTQCGTAHSGPECALGEIRLGKLCEQFEVSLEYWSRAQYEAQWLQGIKRIVGGGLKSCLITSLTQPETANFVFWWPIYREAEFAVFQNQVLFISELGEPLDVVDPLKFVPERETLSESGEPISEWIVALCHLEHWLSTRTATTR